MFTLGNTSPKYFLIIHYAGSTNRLQKLKLRASRLRGASRLQQPPLKKKEKKKKKERTKERKKEKERKKKSKIKIIVLH